MCALCLLMGVVLYYGGSDEAPVGDKSCSAPATDEEDRVEVDAIACTSLKRSIAMMEKRATNGWFILDWQWDGKPRVESVLGLDRTADSIVFALPTEADFAGFAFRTECDQSKWDEPNCKCPIRRWRMDDEEGEAHRGRARVSMVKSHC